MASSWSSCKNSATAKYPVSPRHTEHVAEAHRERERQCVCVCVRVSERVGKYARLYVTQTHSLSVYYTDTYRLRLSLLLLRAHSRRHRVHTASLLEHVLGRLSELDCVNVAKADTVAQHLTVDKADQVLAHLTLQGQTERE
jgi:hypothetical protein